MYYRKCLCFFFAFMVLTIFFYHFFFHFFHTGCCVAVFYLYFYIDIFYMMETNSFYNIYPCNSVLLLVYSTKYLYPIYCTIISARSYFVYYTILYITAYHFDWAVAIYFICLNTIHSYIIHSFLYICFVGPRKTFSDAFLLQNLYSKYSYKIKQKKSRKIETTNKYSDIVSMPKLY